MHLMNVQYAWLHYVKLELGPFCHQVNAAVCSLGAAVRCGSEVTLRLFLTRDLLRVVRGLQFLK